MSDQVIAEIERSVDEWAARLGSMCLVFYAGNEWVVSCHFLNIRTSHIDVMVALRAFDAEAKVFMKRDDKLAQTLGLEAAE
jgi:hypothetical protein